jgi:hypothetical protein
MLDSQMLTSGKGACVLGTRVRNPAAQFEYFFVNEECSAQARLACAATYDTFHTLNTKTVSK